MKKHANNAPATRRPQLDGSMDPTLSFMRLPDGTKVPWAAARPKSQLLQEKARSAKSAHAAWQVT